MRRPGGALGVAHHARLYEAGRASPHYPMRRRGAPAATA
jgi:hypothetical protein